MKNNNILILVFLLIINSQISAGNWVDDWVDQSSSSGSTYYESQKRGYYSGGRYSARWRNSTEYPISVQLPRLRSGCGGIDLFMGGFSFLDPEYLMQKLQRALQSAPAVAFDLALKEACPDCANTIKELESMINKLNQLQMSECSSAQALVKYTGVDEIIGNKLNIAAQGIGSVAGTAKGWLNMNEEIKTNNDKPITTPQQKIASIAHCPVAFKEILAPGSLLNNLAIKKGLGEYVSHMRALIGDVNISEKDGSWVGHYIKPCPNTNSWDIEGLLTGTTPIRTAADNSVACTISTDQGLYQYAQVMMNNIALKITSSEILYNQDEQAFLASTRIAILLQLKQAIIGDRLAITIAALREPVAEAIAYAVLDDMITNIFEMAVLANIAANQKGVANSNAAAKDCNTDAYIAVKLEIQEFKSQAEWLLGAIKTAKAQAMQDYVNSIKFNENLMEQNKTRIQFKPNQTK